MSETVALLAPSEIATLVPKWRELWHRADKPMPFQSPDWLLPWWQQFGTAQPLVATLRTSDHLLGILPIYVLHEENGCKLLPWGVGLSDYFDVLLAADAPADAAERLLATVLGAAPDPAVLDCPDLPPDAALLGTDVPAGWLAEVHGGPICPVLDLAHADGSLAGAVPAITRRKLRMNRNRAERLGGLTVDFATHETLADDLAALMRLHQGRWQAQGEPGVFADPRVGRFHAEAAPKLLEAGLLRLARAHVGGRLAALVMALAWKRDRLAFYINGFEAEFAAVSPGTLLCGALIEAALDAGTKEIHFLRGNESYKHAWGATDRLNSMRRFRRAA